MSRRRWLWVVCWLAVGALAFPAVALASGNNVGSNIANLLKGYASELYGGIAGIASLVFLVNRRYTELGLFLFAAIVVGWLVFAPGSIAHAAEGIAKQIFG